MISSMKSWRGFTLHHSPAFHRGDGDRRGDVHFFHA
jgi:hypothetical protein